MKTESSNNIKLSDILRGRVKKNHKQQNDPERLEMFLCLPVFLERFRSLYKKKKPEKPKETGNG